MEQLIATLEKFEDMDYLIEELIGSYASILGEILCGITGIVSFSRNCTYVKKNL